MKNVLMLTYFFYPFNSTATQRTAKLAKYLPEYGWNPIIICPQWTAKNCRIYDFELEGELDKYNVVRFVTEKGAQRRSMQKLVSVIDAIANPQIFLAKTLSKINRTLVDRKWPVSFYYKGTSFLSDFLQSKEVDCVWATYPPPAVHSLAKWIHMRFGIPWIADFRDVPDQIYTVGHSERLRAYRVKTEPITLSSSSVIITVSEGLKEILQKRHKKPIYVIPNGFDPEDYKKNTTHKNRKSFSIVYTGTITFPHSNPTPLFEAIASLIESKSVKSSEISFYYYGAETELIEKLTRKFSNLGNVINISNFIPLSKCVEIQRQTDILLHLAHAEMKGILTGKLFEYFGARRPILCIPGDNNGVDDLLAQTKAGVVCRNAEQTAEQLLLWYKEWKRTGFVSYHGQEQEIMKYSRKEQARDLAGLLDQVVKNSQ